MNVCKFKVKVEPDSTGAEIGVAVCGCEAASETEMKLKFWLADADVGTEDTSAVPSTLLTTVWGFISEDPGGKEVLAGGAPAAREALPRGNTPAGHSHVQGQSFTVIFVGGEVPPLLSCPVGSDEGGICDSREGLTAPAVVGCVEFPPGPKVITGTER